MTSKAILQTLADYDAWAYGKIFDGAALLGDEELDAPREYGRGSLRNTLFHSVAVLRTWRTLVESGGAGADRPRLEDYPTLAAIRELAEAEHRHFLAYLDSTSELTLEGSLTVRNSRGEEHTFTRWHMLMQALLHGAQHRAEAAVILTELGRSPDNIDFIYFVGGSR